MPDDVLSLALLLLSGLAAGFINVVAGGGSLLTLPALLFLGTPATVANATNRISLIFQNVVATTTFQRGGRLSWRLALRLSLVALPGAFLGAWLALHVDERSFRRILALVMVAVLVLILRGSRREARSDTAAAIPHPRALAVSFFFMGIYAGFLQAGLGFLLIAALTNLGGQDLIRSNALKVTVVLALQVAALVVFQATGNVDWPRGVALASGSMMGAWLGARWQMAQGVVWVRRFLVVAVVGFALRLLWESL